MRSKIAIIGLLSLALVYIQACASTPSLGRSGDRPQQINDISVVHHPDRTEVTVETEGLITYTAFRLGEPERLVVDLPATSLGPYRDEMEINKGALISIIPLEGDEPSYVARLELTLLSQAESRVRAEGNKLIIDIETPLGFEGEVTEESFEAAAMVETEEPIEDQEGEALDEPMVVDEPEEELPGAMAVEEEPVDLMEAEEELEEPMPFEERVELLEEETAEAMAVDGPMEDMEAVEPSEPEELFEVEEPGFAVVSNATVVSSVVVESDRDAARIIISGDGALEPEVFMVGKDRLVTDIEGVMNQVRPSTFKVSHSPVERVRIGQHKDPKKVRVVLDLNREVEFEVAREGEQVVLYVRSIEMSEPPRELKVAEKPMEEPMEEPVPPPKPMAPVQPGPVEAELVVETPKGQYTGRKISLDFQDADLTDVLRLMADVSGLNVIIGPNVKGKVTLKLLNVPWDQSLEIILKMNSLGQIREGNILQIDTLANISKLKSQVAAARTAEEKAEDLVIKILRLNFADAKKLTKTFKKSLGPRGTIDQDIRTNTLIIKDIQKNIDEIMEVAKILDTRTPQVLIEARIVQADRSFSRSLGIMWGITFTDIGSNNVLGLFGGNAGGFGAPTPDFAVNLPATPGFDNVPGAGFSFGRFTDNPINLDLRLSAGELRGVTKTISSPRVITLDNTEAKIEQGESIPFQTTSLQGTQTTFVDANLVLQVTPHVTANKSILMKVRVARNSLGSFSGPAGPSIARREANTEILLQNGETTVIGGIYVDERQDTSTGIPWLSKIPILGWLFKTESMTETKNELLIFLTPTILEN